MPLAGPCPPRRFTAARCTSGQVNLSLTIRRPLHGCEAEAARCKPGSVSFRQPTCHMPSATVKEMRRVRELKLIQPGSFWCHLAASGQANCTFVNSERSIGSGARQGGHRIRAFPVCVAKAEHREPVDGAACQRCLVPATARRVSTTPRIPDACVPTGVPQRSWPRSSAALRASATERGA